MSLEDLTLDERELALECLVAAVEGPFFDEAEFHTLFGLHRAEVAEIAATWRERPPGDDAFLAVNNAINNLVGYPHGYDSVWHDHLSATRDELMALLAKLRGGRPRSYFDALE